MKVLFAVNNENISESIIKKYQASYKEIISAKNVYYFNAIIKELQRDKSYDRVVISEDLEPFSNKNYDMMDKFLFEKLDGISDEASNSTEGEIPIIVICTDRREKADSMLLKLFSIGVYSALIGNDRTIENVCNLINTPRNKKEAKVYYKIESDEADYKSENADNVSESEIQNILIHYKKLGKNEDRYIESFNNIAGQYTDAQLKIISGFLPLNVRAVLEERCPKYQELMMGSVKDRIKKSHNVVTRDIGLPKTDEKIDIIENAMRKPKITNPVIIPNTVNTSTVKKIYSDSVTRDDGISQDTQNVIQAQPNNVNTMETQSYPESVKRGRGRPAKAKPTETQTLKPAVAEVKRGRGRPKKIENIENISEPIENQNHTDVNLFNLSNENKETASIQNDNTIDNQINNNSQMNNQIGNNDFSVLPGLETDEFLNKKTEQENIINSNSVINSNNMAFTNNNQNSNYGNFSNDQQFQPNNMILNQNSTQLNNNTQNLTASSSKVVAFIGTSKNGTSFLINNLALMLSGKGINVAILDLTKNKNSYYIFTKNDEKLRIQATNCIEELRKGNANGISVNRNLTVYTSMPNEESGIEDYGNILETLKRNYSLILLDCDFSTQYEYFMQSQEIYLVQTYDVLTIQPLTSFLRELLDRNILDANKLRIVINKSLRVPGLSKEMIIGGISAYNSPDMTCQKKFFDSNMIMSAVVPFEDQTYSKYLGTLASCELSLNGYSRGLLDALSNLGDMVYPLISSNKAQNQKNYNDYNKNSKPTFGLGNMDNTLNKMRNIH